LVLFDIDGTLISTGGRAGRAIAVAVEQTFGVPVAVDSFPFAGKTDPRIVRELAARAGVPAEIVATRLDEVFDRYLRLLPTFLPPRTVRLLPGVRPVLDALAARPDIALGLLTGNLARGAEVKLGAAGIRRYFPIGAFGSDDEDRDRLVPIARARARSHFGTEFPGRSTIVIGDAEADVRCARAGEARAVAVASGWTPRDVLAALAPDVLLDSLGAADAVDALLGT
jgi:phosphoglycolate phosphatase-like HAD superfamily hydrolase